VSCSADKSIAGLNAEGAVSWRIPSAHDASINCIQYLNEHSVATGDDDGCVKLWDVRSRKPTATFEECEDFIADMAFRSDGYRLLAASGDGTLSVYDLRSSKFEAMSDVFEDELLSVAVMKGGTRVVVGSQDGVLSVFHWGWWGDCKDRFPGHPKSIDSLCALNDDVVLTASSDGMIRIVQIQPNKLLGVVGEHGEFPIERLAMSVDKSMLASISHDGMLKLWNIRYLQELASNPLAEGSEMSEGMSTDASDPEDGSDDSDAMEDRRKGKGKERQAPRGKGSQHSKQAGASRGFFDDL